MPYILGVGTYGNDVRRLQEYLNRELAASLVADGAYGGNTKTEVLRFRRRFGLPEAPTFDDQCFAVSGPRGFAAPAFDTSPAKKTDDWPKRPRGLSSPSGALMQEKCGEIAFRHAPEPGNAEHIIVTNGVAETHIVRVEIPQLANAIVPLDHGVSKTDGRIRFHKNHAERLVKLFQDWERAGLTDRILTFDGAFHARLKRDAHSATTKDLSNHAWGTAFDINADWNPRKFNPAHMGVRGCLRELVAIGHDNGFYWGGHFSTRDGMHFEVAAERL